MTVGPSKQWNIFLKISRFPLLRSEKLFIIDLVAWDSFTVSWDIYVLGVGGLELVTADDVPGIL
jgi:hypothetical protein